MSFNCFAVVPAAGSGSRLQQVTGNNPKVLFKLQTPDGERSLLSIAVGRILEANLFSGIVIACSQVHLEQCKEDIDALFKGPIPIELIIGGLSRQETALELWNIWLKEKLLT